MANAISIEKHGRRGPSLSAGDLCGAAACVIIRSAVTCQQTIAEIIRRLIEFYQPERIYLFGSAARGDAGPDSDLDFLVVIPDDAPVEKLRAGAVYQKLSGIIAATDIVPWRRSDFDARAEHVVASLPATVVREGKLLYEAARSAGG